MIQEKSNRQNPTEIEFLAHDFCTVENNLLDSAEIDLMFSQNDFMFYPDQQDYFYSVLRVTNIVKNCVL